MDSDEKNGKNPKQIRYYLGRVQRSAQCESANRIRSSVPRRMKILFLIALNFIVYYRTFRFGLIVDDVRHKSHIEAKDSIFDSGLIKSIPHRLYGVGTLARKVSMNCGKDKRFQVNARDEHILSTAIHSLICVLIYLSLGKLPIIGAQEIAFCAAILYSVNPANNQTSIWLNGRRYAVNIILVLLMILAGPVGILLYPLTALFQVSAIFSPILFGWIGLAVLPIFWLISSKDIKERVSRRLKAIKNDDQRTFTPKKLIPITKTYGSYWLKMLLPGRTMMVYPNLFYWGMTKEGNKDAYSLNGSFWFGVACVVLSLGGVLVLKGQMFFMFLFMCLSVAQWCGFISVTQMFTDRYISLPNVFMMFFVSYFAHQTLGFYAPAAIALLAGYYFANLQVTMQMYKDMESFWDYQLYYDPAGVKIREFKASHHMKDGDPVAAWEVIRKGLEYNPTDFKLNLLAANCLKALGDPQAVIAHIKVAKDNCYINQEFILEEFNKRIFGVDIKAENEKIKNKTSKFDRKERESIQKLQELIGV